MRRTLIALLLAPILANAASWLHNPLGSATVAAHEVDEATNLWWDVTLPEGDHDAFTVTMWTRFRRLTPKLDWITTSAWWCGDPVEMPMPDLLQGGGGHPDDWIDLTAAGGVVAFPAITFGCWPDVPVAVSNRYPRGVYNLTGTSSETITITLGGADYNVGPGAFDRAAEPGPADGVAISGGGLARVAVSLSYIAQYQHEIDGVIASGENTLSPDSVITNELSFCTWRFRVEGDKQIYRSDLGRLPAFDIISIVATNDAPRCGKFSRFGRYRVGLQGISVDRYNHVDLTEFDVRIRPWWVSDHDLRRIHIDGVAEITRREIPTWDVPPNHLTFTFVDAVPATVTLGADYAGPASALAPAQYDSGDGVWRDYDSKTITMRGQYLSFRGDWRTAAGTYAHMFSSSFIDYPCTLAGRFQTGSTVNAAFNYTFHKCSGLTGAIPADLMANITTPAGGNGYFTFRSMFRECSGLTGMVPAGLFGRVSGQPTTRMFESTFQRCTGITGAEDGWVGDLRGDNATAMFAYMFHLTTPTGASPSPRVPKGDGTYEPLYVRFPDATTAHVVFAFQVSWGKAYSDQASIPAAWK